MPRGGSVHCHRVTTPLGVSTKQASHRLLQCAQIDTMPSCVQFGAIDFGSTSGLADPEGMPRLHVRDYLPNLKTVIWGGSYASSLMFSATYRFHFKWVRCEHGIQLKESFSQNHTPTRTHKNDIFMDDITLVFVVIIRGDVQGYRCEVLAENIVQPQNYRRSNFSYLQFPT